MKISTEDEKVEMCLCLCLFVLDMAITSFGSTYKVKQTVENHKNSILSFTHTPTKNGDFSAYLKGNIPENGQAGVVFRPVWDHELY